MKAVMRINPRLFLKLGKQQYKNHAAIIAVRELLQNSRDACKRVNRVPDIRISVQGNEPTIINCRDNGCGMSELDICEKLLQLGGPSSNNKGKDDVGGFGVAKAVLFSCEPWYVKSHNHYLNNEIFFAEDEIPTSEFLDGTEVQVSVEKRVTLDDLLLAFGMVAFSDVPVKFTYGNQTETVVFSGDLKLHKETGQCRVYLTDPITVFGQTLSGYAVYRLKGLVQFIEDKDFEGFNVIVDINADDLDTDSPDYPLTSSREGLRGNTWYQIYQLLFDFRENPNTTRANLADDENAVTLYEDKIFTSDKKKKPAKKEEDSPNNLDDDDQVEEDELDNDCQDTDLAEEDDELDEDSPVINLADDDQVEEDQVEEDNQDNDCQNSDLPDESVEDKPQHVCRHSRPGMGLPVIVKGRKEKPTVEEKRYLRIWGEVVRLVSPDPIFGVGIVKSKHAGAARMKYGQYPYYLLNTSILPELSKDGLILYLWVLAQHECSHVYQDNHNETFTSLIATLAAESADSVSPAIVKIKRGLARRI